MKFVKYLIIFICLAVLGTAYSFQPEKGKEISKNDNLIAKESEKKEISKNDNLIAKESEKEEVSQNDKTHIEKNYRS